MLCGKNPALEAVKSAQDALKSAMAGGKAALASVTSKVAELKSKINGMIPQLPSLDSFQAELAGLVGATPDKIAQFQAKWNGKVADLNNLVAKATSGISGALDFCKDVPNVKMDPATGETVEEAKEAQTPNENPAEVEKVEPTVKTNTSVNSSGVSAGTYDDFRRYLAVVPSRMKNEVYGRIMLAQKTVNAEYNEVKKQHKAILAKIQSDSITNNEQFLEAATKILSPEEFATFNTQIMPAATKCAAINTYFTLLSFYEALKEKNITYGEPTVAQIPEMIRVDVSNYNQWYHERAEAGYLPRQDGTRVVAGATIQFDLAFIKIDAILDGNSALVKGYRTYLDNKP